MFLLLYQRSPHFFFFFLFLIFLLLLAHALRPVVAVLGDGYTLAQCEIDADCEQPRVCTFSPGRVEESRCTGQKECFCVPPNGLQACEHCYMCSSHPRETCLTRGHDYQPFCLTTSLLVPNGEPGQEQVATLEEVGFGCNTSVSPSPTVSGTPSPTPTTVTLSSPSKTPMDRVDGGDGGSCVDARLFDVGQPGEGHATLFATHRTARVLCDHEGSCATPGHIVVYHDVAMTMRKYCAGVRMSKRRRAAQADGGCETVVMQVNSPKYRPGLRMRSKTDGLYLTALAARFETAAEEALLRTAMRLGL